MTEEQLKALKAYIHAVIDEKIEEAFGRDSLLETRKRSEYEDELSEAFK